MSNPRKNLLEAFRRAGESTAPPNQTNAGPFAEEREEVVEAEPRRQRHASDAARELRVPAMPAWLPWAAGIAFAFVLGIALGRGSGEESVAAETGSARDEAPFTSSLLDPPADLQGSRASEERSDASQPRASARSGAVDALFDPANRYTVIACTYADSREDYAKATYDHLRDEGLPVFPPARRGRNILVLVGAAPRVDGLEGVLERLRGLPAWNGAADGYADAYAERIDRLIDREGR